VLESSKPTYGIERAQKAYALSEIKICGLMATKVLMLRLTVSWAIYPELPLILGALSDQIFDRGYLGAGYGVFGLLTAILAVGCLVIGSNERSSESMKAAGQRTDQLRGAMIVESVESFGGEEIKCVVMSCQRRYYAVGSVFYSIEEAMDAILSARCKPNRK